MRYEGTPDAFSHGDPFILTNCDQGGLEDHLVTCEDGFYEVKKYDSAERRLDTSEYQVSNGTVTCII